VQRSCDARATGQLLECIPRPYQILMLRNVKIQAQQNYLPKPLPRAKALRHKSFTLSENKEAKNNCPSHVPRYATIARHLNVVKLTLHGTFEKKWNTLLMLELCLKEHDKFWTVSYFLGGEVFQQLRTMFNVTKFLYYFDLFLQQLKAKNLSMIALLQTLQC